MGLGVMLIWQACQGQGQGQDQGQGQGQGQVRVRVRVRSGSGSGQGQVRVKVRVTVRVGLMSLWQALHVQALSVPAEHLVHEGVTATVCGCKCCEFKR